MQRALLALAVVAAVVVPAWLSRTRGPRAAADLPAALDDARRSATWIVAHVRHRARPLGVEMDRARATHEWRVAADRMVEVTIDAERDPALAARLIGSGAALGTALLDEQGDVVAARPGFARATELRTFLVDATARRAMLEELGRRLRATPGDDERRLDRIELLLAGGAFDRVEEELAQLADPRTPRAVAAAFEVDLAAGRLGAARDGLALLEARYPAAPSTARARARFAAVEPALPVERR